jgi:integrase
LVREEKAVKRHNPYPGLHKSPKRLADGTTKTYHYAWKGGPPLPFSYGSPEFATAFLHATASRASTPDPTKIFQVEIDKYLLSRGKRKRGSGFSGFLELAERTQADYRKYIKSDIEPQFGEMPLAALEDKRARGTFLDYRDELAAISERRADYVMQVLSVILSFAVDRGVISRHPLLKIGRVYDGSRADKIFTDEMEAQFVNGARPDMGAALTLAIAIGQRAGDVLSLPWDRYDGTVVQVKQRKTGRLVPVPLLDEVRDMLDRMPRKGATILTNLSGEPWTYGGFSAVFNDEMKRLGIEGAAFGDARGTTVTRLRRAGASNAEIGAITGHSNAEISRILEKHYAAYDPVLANQAIAKLAAYYAATRKA